MHIAQPPEHIGGKRIIGQRRLRTFRELFCHRVSHVLNLAFNASRQTAKYGARDSQYWNGYAHRNSRDILSQDAELAAFIHTLQQPVRLFFVAAGNRA